MPANYACIAASTVGDEKRSGPVGPTTARLCPPTNRRQQKQVLKTYQLHLCRSVGVSVCGGRNRSALIHIWCSSNAFGQWG